MYNFEEMTKLLSEELSQSLVLDGTKIQWYADRVKKFGKVKSIGKQCHIYLHYTLMLKKCVVTCV